MLVLSEVTDLSPPLLDHGYLRSPMIYTTGFFADNHTRPDALSPLRLVVLVGFESVLNALPTRFPEECWSFTNVKD